MKISRDEGMAAYISQLHFLGILPPLWGFLSVVLVGTIEPHDQWPPTLFFLTPEYFKSLFLYFPFTKHSRGLYFQKKIYQKSEATKKKINIKIQMG